MDKNKRAILCALAIGASCFGVAAPASAAVSAPYTVKVAYESATARATVTWGADAPAAYGFDIERRPVGRTPWTKIGYVREPGRSYLDTTAAPLTRYEYRVIAYRPDGVTAGHISTSTATIPLHFPYNRPYPHGIRPNVDQGLMNADVKNMYDLWRAKYVTTTGAGTNGARVYKPDENGETVSEGQGYGMLISVYMADANNNGKTDFDKMLNYYWSKVKRDPDSSLRGMNWRVQANGGVRYEPTATPPVDDRWIAPDGDIDVAFALLVADRKWGSSTNGNPDYLGSARAILTALQKYNTYNRTSGTSKLIANIDKNLDWQETDTSWTMSSYQIVSYMQQFAAADSTRAAQWRDTLKAAYRAYSWFYNKNPGTALTPFTFRTQPGTNQYLKGVRHYTFGPDSCRVPWRVGMDYLWYGNANSTWANSQDASVRATLAKDLPKVNVNWFISKVGNDPSTAWYSYELNGTPASTSHWGQRHTTGSMAVGAMTDSANQTNLNNLYAWMRVQIPGLDYTAGAHLVPREYYGDTVLMLNMIAVTGNMPNLPGIAIPAQ